jgi:hypothetical protein
MIPNSFTNELLKQAAPVGFLANLGKVLGQYVPSALTATREAGLAAGLGNVAKAKLLGGAVGAIGGGLAGGNVGSDENKSRNRLLGAVAGGAAGALGGGSLSKKLPSFGLAAGPALQNLGTYMSSEGATMKGVLDHMATKWAPKLESVKGVVDKGQEAILKKTTPAGATLGHLGDTAQNVQTALGRRGGIADVLQGNVHEHTFKEKSIDGQKYLFNRTGAGKVIAPLLNSGLGMGALSAATAEGKDGQKPTVGKRLLSGGSTALAWGAAPKLMMGKMLAYDVPKTLIGMKKPKATDVPTQ